MRSDGPPHLLNIERVTPMGTDMSTLSGTHTVSGHVSGPVSSSFVSVWIDPHIPGPDGWVWCRTGCEAIEIAKTTEVAYLSTDADHGVALLTWMSEQNRWVTRGVRIHTGHPAHVRRCLLIVDQHGPFPFAPETDPNTRGQAPGYVGESGWPDALHSSCDLARVAG